jgi:hypothetical protein
VTTMVEILLGFAVGRSLALWSATARPERAVRAPRVAVPRRRPGDPDPRARPRSVLWFGPGSASKVVICALIVFFPVAIATMVGIRSVDAGCSSSAQPARHAPPGPHHARDPGRPAEHLRRHAGRRDARGGRRDRRRVGRRRAGAWPSLITSPGGRCSTSR